MLLSSLVHLAHALHTVLTILEQINIWYDTWYRLWRLVTSAQQCSHYLHLGLGLVLSYVLFQDRPELIIFSLLPSTMFPVCLIWAFYLYCYTAVDLFLCHRSKLLTFPGLFLFSVWFLKLLALRLSTIELNIQFIIICCYYIVTCTSQYPVSLVHYMSLIRHLI